AQLNARARPIQLNGALTGGGPTGNLEKRTRLQVAAVGPARLETEGFKLCRYVFGRQFLASRSRAAPFKKVVGQEAHIRAKSGFAEMVRRILNLSGNVPVLRAGDRKQGKHDDDGTADLSRHFCLLYWTRPARNWRVVNCRSRILRYSFTYSQIFALSAASPSPL